jgi:hypothetical protein
MLIRADVKCYYCGFISGQIEGSPDSSQPRWSYRYRARGPRHSDAKDRQIRCVRCGGPVFLDDIETVRGSAHASQPSLVSATA